MTEYRYLHLDVFTATRFEGNQLAVFPDARGLSDEVMQTIAREMAFSETTFVLPAERDDTNFRVRIFTPEHELPMAGHPTIGTAFALAAEGSIEAGRDRVVFGLGVGPTPVDLAWHDGDLEFAWMTQRQPEFGIIIEDPSELETIAQAVGLRPDDFVPGGIVQVVSSGVPFLFVPVRTRDLVDQANPDRRALARRGSARGRCLLHLHARTGHTGSDGVLPHVHGGPPNAGGPRHRRCSRPLRRIPRAVRPRPQGHVGQHPRAPGRRDATTE